MEYKTGHHETLKALFAMRYMHGLACVLLLCVFGFCRSQLSCPDSTTPPFDAMVHSRGKQWVSGLELCGNGIENRRDDDVFGRIPSVLHRSHRFTLSQLHVAKEDTQAGRTKRNIESCVSVSPTAATAYYDDDQIAAATQLALRRLQWPA